MSELTKNFVAHSILNSRALLLQTTEYVTRSNKTIRFNIRRNIISIIFHHKKHSRNYPADKG